MCEYASWEARNNAPIPYSVIIDTEDMTITELSEAEAQEGHIRKEIQKIVPNPAWLYGLYTMMGDLRSETSKWLHRIHSHYDKAQWLEGH